MSLKTRILEALIEDETDPETRQLLIRAGARIAVVCPPSLQEPYSGNVVLTETERELCAANLIVDCVKSIRSRAGVSLKRAREIFDAARDEMLASHREDTK